MRHITCSTLAAFFCVAGLLTFSATAQAPSDVRIALVIGNSAYPGQMALANPANDAKDMATTLRAMGFGVVEAIDSDHAKMKEAIARVSTQLQGRQGIGMLFYAGHGLQLDWRNYMVPVDARLNTASDVPKQTVDIEAVMTAFKTAGNRMNIVVLDACRDNPFANGKTTSGKGLAPLDAPTGTFLAYATAPGNVAADGTGKNGLYTGYLLQELQKPNASIENVFKRVRFSVRKASNGAQVPWETTSLEDDFYFSKPPKLSETELEKQALVQQERWVKIQNANDLQLLQAFLYDYPTGMFSEIATFRIKRLEAEAQRQEAIRQADAKLRAERMAAEAAAKLEQARIAADTAVRQEQQRIAAMELKRKQDEERMALDTAKRLEQERMAQEKLADAALRKQLEDQERVAKLELARKQEEQRLAAATSAQLEQARLAAEQDNQRKEQERIAQETKRQEAIIAEQLKRVTANNIVVQQAKPGQDVSRQSVELVRNYKVGMRAVWDVSETFPNKSESKRTYRVTKVGDNTVEINNGNIVWDTMGNPIKDGSGESDGSRPLYPAELRVGKRWSGIVTHARSDGRDEIQRYSNKITKRENVTTPAGTFDCYLIETTLFQDVEGRKQAWRTLQKTWISADVPFVIASEIENYRNRLNFIRSFKLSALSNI